MNNAYRGFHHVRLEKEGQCADAEDLRASRHGAGAHFWRQHRRPQAHRKTIKGQQSLACELYDTGKMEAMYLAALVADGKQMTAKQLDRWAEKASALRMIAEYTVPWVTVENPAARELALKWMKSNKELVASAGWSTYSGIVAMTPDDALDLGEIEELLGQSSRASRPLRIAFAAP